MDKANEVISYDGFTREQVESMSDSELETLGDERLLKICNLMLKETNLQLKRRDYSYRSEN